MDKSLIAALLLLPSLALAQTHTMPGSNVVPSGATLTLQSGSTTDFNAGATVDFTGATVTGLATGGTPGGSTTQVQFNNSSAFGGITGATTDGTTLSLKNLNMLLSSGTDNSTITFGNNYNQPAIYLYDNGAAFRYGWGLRLSEMQFFAPTGAHFSWNKAGDFQPSNTNELMRLDNTSGVLNVLSGYKLGGAEFPIASNGLVKRTAANTYAVAVAGTDYQVPATTLAGYGITDAVKDTGDTMTGVLDLPQGTVTAPGLTHGAGVGTGIYTTGSGASAIYNVTVNGALKMSLSTTVLSSGNYIRGTTGLISSPAFSFTAETNAGIYRAGAGDIRIASSGVDVQKWLTSGISDLTTGLTVGGAAATGKILIGDGTKFAASTPTYPTAAGTTGYLVRSDGTNFTSYPNQQTNSSVTNKSFTTSDTYLTGSSCVVAAGDFKAGGQYRCVFDMVKTAGTGAIVISVRIGTAGTTSDTAQLTFTFGAGTSVADSGVFDVVVNWRTVGGGSSAVVQGICRGTHNLATTGLFNNAAGWVIIGTPSGGFNSSAATTIGLSFNGATAFSGTNSLVQAQLQQ